MRDYLLAAKINFDVNMRVVYKGDLERHGVPEQWSVAVTEGDCEDYALAKFEALRAAGVPAENMRLACIYIETGGYHAVLVVTCKGGDWVLDNRYPEPFATWREKGYTLDKIWSHKLNAWESGG